MTTGHCEGYSLIAKPLTTWHIIPPREVQGKEGYKAPIIWPHGVPNFSVITG